MSSPFPPYISYDLEKIYKPTFSKSDARENVDNVCEHLCLSNGYIWPIPIVFDKLESAKI